MNRDNINKPVGYDGNEFFLNGRGALASDESGSGTKTFSAVSDNGNSEPAPLPGTFELSLDGFTAKSLPKQKKVKKKRKLGADGIARLIVLCVCIGVFAYAVVNIIQYKVDQWISNSMNEQIQNQMYQNIDEAQRVIGKQKPTRLYPDVDLLTYLGSDEAGTNFVEPDRLDYYETLRDNLREITELYPNTYGWITVSNTQIDYPIMKTKNNEYYLKYSWKGERSSAGAIFADCTLSSDYASNRNVVIYGHDMTSGAMFRGIKQFFDSDYRYTLAQNMEITVITLDGVYIYEFFSGYRNETGFFIKTSFKDDSQFTSFLKRIRSENRITKSASYDKSSKIITLVTCTNVSSKPNERYALHGILKEVIKFED